MAKRRPRQLNDDLYIAIKVKRQPLRLNDPLQLIGRLSDDLFLSYQDIVV